MNSTWDCIVVGAGAAGLSAALVLGRARRRTLVVDAGDQSNLRAHGIGGLLGNDGTPPAAFYATAREQLAAYPSVELRSGEVVGGGRDGEELVLELASGEREHARRVLLAGGMDYRYPSLPGSEERWGGSVFHCPFCHGWEVRDRPLGVLDKGADGVRRALLLRAWSDDVTLLTSGPAAIEAADAERLAAAGVAVDEREVSGLRGPGAELEAVVFADGDERPCGGLLVPVVLNQRSRLAARLGVAVSPRGAMATDAVDVDGSFATTTPGVFAAGDVVVKMPSVANAISAGSTAAAVIVHDLML